MADFMSDAVPDGEPFDTPWREVPPRAMSSRKVLKPSQRVTVRGDREWSLDLGKLLEKGRVAKARQQFAKQMPGIMITTRSLPYDRKTTREILPGAPTIDRDGVITDRREGVQESGAEYVETLRGDPRPGQGHPGPGSGVWGLKEPDKVRVGDVGGDAFDAALMDFTRRVATAQDQFEGMDNLLFESAASSARGLKDAYVMGQRNLQYPTQKEREKFHVMFAEFLGIYKEDRVRFIDYADQIDEMGEEQARAKFLSATGQEAEVNIPKNTLPSGTRTETREDIARQVRENEGLPTKRWLDR